MTIKLADILIIIQVIGNTSTHVFITILAIFAVLEFFFIFLSRCTIVFSICDGSPLNANPFTVNIWFYYWTLCINLASSSSYFISLNVLQTFFEGIFSILLVTFLCINCFLVQKSLSLIPFSCFYAVGKPEYRSLYDNTKTNAFLILSTVID